MKSKMIVGGGGICWAIWLTRNNIFFDKTILPSYLHVIFKEIDWARSWSILQKQEDCH